MAQSHKDMALTFLRTVFRGNVREAYLKYVAPNFRHHNAYFPADTDALMKGMEENSAKFPDKTMEIQRAIAESDLVAVHSRICMKPGDRGLAVVHIFRFEGERIAEMWDLGQPVPENSPNANGMF